VTNLYQLLRIKRHHVVQHDDRIVTIDYCDVTSAYAYLHKLIHTRTNTCIAKWWSKNTTTAFVFKTFELICKIFGYLNADMS